MPVRTNTTASKMANAHTAALGSLITGRNMFDAFMHRTIRRAYIQLTKPQFFLSGSHAPYNLQKDVMKKFGDFEFDNRRRGLKAGGHPVRLSAQAVDLLALLLERPGELITRQEIERHF